MSFVVSGSRKYVLELWRKQHGDVFRILSRLRQWEYRAFHPDEGKLDQSLSVRSTCAKQTTVNTSHIIKDILGSHGITILYRRHYGQECRTSSKLMDNYGAHMLIPCMARSVSSQALDKPVQSANKTKKDISTIEDPFDAPTYNIPEKLVTFTEGASYNVIILAGLGVVVAATYAIFKELIFEPKEYKIFNKALKRIQDDAQVNNMMLLSSLWLGRELDTLYGQESRNRAAHQRIPNRTWTDEDSEEHVEVNFYIRGPHGAGKVFTEMYKDKTNGQWMYTYLIIEIRIPSPAQLILESYLPAYAAP